ncbi:hypothetical protein QMK17_15525 [Rhodococcus sp. G-MC3]|uniref:DUF6802 family protein n=1 Tax=Rhodococcus sp. G-MC3 TaxID=3046209 RepID=UPI0024BA0C5D|nr:DUF6802 family protein [Rhodococcus sp. G-MC3]MDJ0394735.1 hypothetical protein [Rhodococcus sp. G-MC3]
MDFGDAFFLDADPARPAGPADPSELVGHGALATDAVSLDVFDVDADGYAETRVHYTEDGMTVAVDVDGDGVIDTFTAVGRGGHYDSWEIFRVADGTARWERTSSGDVFD